MAAHSHSLSRLAELGPVSLKWLRVWFRLSKTAPGLAILLFGTSLAPFSAPCVTLPIGREGWPAW
jgi:hypothetical protein